MNLYSQLQMINLSYSYHQQPLFTGINLELVGGEVLQIAGDNGKGKTTLLRMLAGLLPPLEGYITWNNIKIEKSSEQYCRDVIYLGHLLGLKPYLTVYENLLFSVQMRGYEVDKQTILN